MLFFVFLFACLLAGLGISEGLWAREQRLNRLVEAPGPFERAASGMLVGFALAFAINWVLALTGLLFRGTVLAATLACAAGGILWLVRTLRRSRNLLTVQFDPWASTVVLLALAPLIFWFVYLMWRGSLVPVLAPDANVYHLPKALQLIRQHGYAFFDFPADFRVPYYPFNYELLLADALLLNGSDTGTAWIAMLGCVAVLLQAGAAAERWWGRGSHALGAILAVATVPVLLLNASTQKNETLNTFLLAAGLFWLGRWVVLRERLVAGLLLTSVIAALGTKTHSGFVAVVALPVALVALIRRREGTSTIQRRDVIGLVALTIVEWPLLGAWVPINNYLHGHSLFGVPPDLVGGGMWGKWSNLWKFPYLLLTVPFAQGKEFVWVPWLKQYYWWMRYEMHTSHYGPLMSVLFVVGLLLLWLNLRGKSLPGSRRREWLVATGAGVAAFLLLLPMRLTPAKDGDFHAFPRYLAFVLPLVVAGGLSPLLARFRLLRGGGKLAMASALLVLSFWFSTQAYEYTKEDIYAPVDYLDHLTETPSRIPLQKWWRGAFYLDLKADPSDTIAVAPILDTWIYPLYGAHFTRPVKFISFVDGKAVIPDDARYVLIDDAHQRDWGHPKFKTMADVEWLGHGSLSPMSVRLLRQLVRDPRYRLLYKAFRCQFVFERVDARTPPLLRSPAAQ